MNHVKHQGISSSGPHPRRHSSEMSNGKKRQAETAKTMPSIDIHHDSGRSKSPRWHDGSRAISIRLPSDSQRLSQRKIRTNSRKQIRGPPPPIPKWIDVRPPTSPTSKSRPISRQPEVNPLPLSDLAMIMSSQLTIAIERGSFGDLEDKHDEE